MSSLSLVVVLTLLAISFKGSTACVCIQLADETKICLADFGKLLYIAKFFINFIDFNYKLQFRNIVSFLFFYILQIRGGDPSPGRGHSAPPLFLKYLQVPVFTSESAIFSPQQNALLILRNSKSNIFENFQSLLDDFHSSMQLFLAPC